MKPGLQFLLLFICHQLATAQSTRSLDYYLLQAHDHSPVLKEIYNQQKFNILKNDLTWAQYKKPTVGVTGDYLFAPYFADNKKIISITDNPDEKAYGYDPALSNGGLYAILLNASFPLFKEGFAKTINNQNFIQNQWLQNQLYQQIHDIDKSITDQYIQAYQLQQMLQHLRVITDGIIDRKKIVEALVQKAIMQQSDFQLIEIEISIRENDYLQQRVSLTDAFMQLNNLCGIEDTMIYELDPPLLQLSPPVDQYSFLEKYKLDSLSIRADEDIFNLKYKPQLDAYSNTGINASRVSTIPHNIGLSAGLHLSVPLYDGEQKKVVRQQNKLLMQNLREYKSTTFTQKHNSLINLQHQIQLTQLSLAGFNEQLKKQEALLEIIKNKVIYGQSSITDYRLALQDYVATNQNILQTQTNLWLLINQYNYINW
jgi:hypothetical protein